MGRINFIDVSLKYKDKIILENANIDIEFNKLLIKGRNGIGKTSILNAILNENNFSGKILMNSIDITNMKKKERNKKIKYLKQDFMLYDELTIYEHLKLFKIVRDEMENLVINFNMFDKLDKKVKHLSGGEKQIMSICMLSLKNSELLILDEPFNHISSNNKSKLEILLKEISKDIIMVSHQDVDFVDKIVFVSKRGLYVK